MTIVYGNIDSIISGFNVILKLQSIGGPPTVPSPLILLGVPTRQGLSASKIASRIIARKSEAGLPVGALPSGGISPDEIMERIRIEEIINALLQEAVITVVIPAGTPITAAGASAAGPVSVVGATVNITQGYGIIQ